MAGLFLLYPPISSNVCGQRSRTSNTNFAFFLLDINQPASAVNKCGEEAMTISSLSLAVNPVLSNLKKNASIFLIRNRSFSLYEEVLSQMNFISSIISVREFSPLFNLVSSFNLWLKLEANMVTL